MKEKKVGLTVVTVLLIIAILVIAVMGCIIYKLSTNTQNNEEKITELQTEKKKLQQALNSIQDILNNVIETENNKNDTDLLEKELKETAQKFVNAVNQKDWETVEDCSSEWIVSSLKQYNVTNMEIKDYSDYRQLENSYAYVVSYEMEYFGSTSPKDFGMGYGLILEKVNGKFVVTEPFATGM